MRPALASTQFRHGLHIAGVTGQQKAAQPLDRRNPPLRQRPCGRVDALRIRPFARAGGNGRNAAPDKPKPRPARRARIGLRVETAIVGILVLGPTDGAERKTAHARHGAIVGNGTGDRVAGAAVGAIGEGVAVATVARIADIGKAGVAGGDVGADKHGVAAPPPTPDDPEAAFLRQKRERHALP